MKDLKGINSETAKAEFAARAKAQEDHLEEKYGPVRAIEARLADTHVNHALLNWIMTLHNFSHLRNMEVLNAIQNMMMVHVNLFESKVKKMEAALGSETMKRLDIDPTMLYPSEVAVRGLEDVAAAARARSKANRYGIKTQSKPKIIPEV